MRVFVSRLSRAVSRYAPSARNVYGLSLNIAIRNLQFHNLQFHNSQFRNSQFLTTFRCHDVGHHLLFRLAV
jgi:hypothetical protein